MPRALRIHWQRLVGPEGQTCPRCADAEDEVQRAVAILDQLLPPLGIQPELEITEITEIDTSACQANPGRSNRITIADRSIEEWLGGLTAGIRCRALCGDSDGRTIEADGDSVEAIPEWLMLMAALLAAAALLDEAPNEALSCCS